nr:MAG: capsid protein [Cressdnaviricota sp.]
MKRKYGQTFSKSSGIVAKRSNYKRAKYNPIPKQISYGNVAKRYSSNGFRVSSETKTLDTLFTAAYTAGTYTPDTFPTTSYQMLPLNIGTATVQALNLCQQGTGISQRVGNKISMKSLKIRLQLQQTANTSPQTNNHNRFLIVYDRQPNTTYPASNTILSSIGGNNVLANGIYTDSLNPNLMDRYTILMDEMLVLPQWDTGAITATSNTTSTEHREFCIDRYINLKSLVTNYSGSASPMTLSLISTGALYVICYGSASINGTDSWQLYGSIRLRYHDN